MGFESYTRFSLPSPCLSYIDGETLKSCLTDLADGLRPMEALAIFAIWQEQKR
jgi:hypothetical protein